MPWFSNASQLRYWLLVGSRSWDGSRNRSQGSALEATNPVTGARFRWYSAGARNEVPTDERIRNTGLTA